MVGESFDGNSVRDAIRAIHDPIAEISGRSILQIGTQAFNDPRPIRSDRKQPIRKSDQIIRNERYEAHVNIDGEPSSKSSALAVKVLYKDYSLEPA